MATVEPPPAEASLIADVPLTDAERVALQPPGNLTVSQWAAKYQVLPEHSPLGNRWLNESAPALAALQDLATEDWLRELYLRKAVQAGGSQIFQNILGCYADQNPLPQLIILPTEKDAKKNFRKRWLPMYRGCGPLRKLKTRRAHDETSLGVRLSNGLEVDVGWAGSASSLASDPKAIVFVDETDKYDHAGSKEAPPVALARRRTTQYADVSKLFAASTPTLPEGQIEVLYQSAEIKLSWHVPCPHCGRHQPLHQDALKWEKYDGEPRLRAARIKADRAAWFECVHPACRGRILEEHRRQIEPLGYWATEDQGWRAYPDGRREGTRPPGDRVGVVYPSFHTLKRKWHALAADWVLAGNDPDALKDIVTQDFAEPFQQRAVAAVGVDKFSTMCRPDPSADPPFTPAPAGVVPLWASRLLLTIDTQVDYFFWTLRAYGYAGRSQRIAHGTAKTFAELDAIEMTPRRYGDDVYPPLAVFRTGIDTGGTGDGDDAPSRTEQVYRWCLQKPTLRVPLKGSSRPVPGGVRYAAITYTPPGGKRGPFDVLLHLFDTQFFAGLLMAAWDGVVPSGDAVNGPAPQWALNDNDDADYNRHLSNLHVAPVKYRGGTVRRIVPKGLGVRVDYFDCEKMAVVLAVGMNLCTALETPLQLAGRLATATNAPAQITHRGIRRPDGRGWFTKR